MAGPQCVPSLLAGFFSLFFLFLGRLPELKGNFEGLGHSKGDSLRHFPLGTEEAWHSRFSLCWLWAMYANTLSCILSAVQ